MALIGPRFAILAWWVFDQTRWEQAFDNFWVALAGFLFIPWTTLAWVLVAPNGVRGFDYIIIGLAIVFDIGSYSGGGRQGRIRYQTV
jgi:hypothetical protein